MLGLDGSGKSTIFEKLNLGEVKTVIPANNFVVRYVQFKKSDLVSF